MKKGAKFPTLKTNEKVGRRECGCFGTEHRAAANCQSCGRIHCSEEVPGKCLFCGERLEIIRKPEGYDEAQEKMDMLLYFQQTQAQRSVVRDMAGEDPMKLDLWLKKQPKKPQRQKKEISKKVLYGKKVQYQNDDSFNADFMEEDDIGTAQVYNINVKKNVDTLAEDADYED
ncbi:hypothetical protein EIN_023990 [Entamoeba invadens IP1]|uniref:hypothetical protein n=1 Tax=Entamoeba invadens IP1 TaxID=370355 RepID=UPI0002C3F85C|nr:hypothetical protein EIN_023990 [Entamoeba invadens IP1]ELP90690.1 hypothetical protein EIN_023990 [Entamoeba invadens IP1]|eukprot:XP_004257461.1 hypothetical protein EIN_023990 [Entamoeba invadens IP1]